MWMRFGFLLSVLLIGLGSEATTAQSPALNLNPGLWEYTNELRFEGNSEPETQVFEGCVTQEDLDSGQFMQQDIDACEMTDQQLSPNRMVYTMACQGPEGSALTIEADIELNGDTAQGVINNTVTTPAGDMAMAVNLTARREGPCPESESE